MTSTGDAGEFDAVMDALGVGPERDSWRDGWDESRRSFDPGRLGFLRPAFVRRLCGELGIPGDVREAVVASLAAFEQRPALKRLAWHCHRRLFVSPPPDAGEPPKIELPRPSAPDELPPWGEMFHAVVLLSGGRFLQKLHASRGIGAEVTRDTAGDLTLWMRHYRRRTGRWGLDQARWLVSHFTGRIFRLGRLQFRFEAFERDVRAYRNGEDGRVVLLAPGGARFRADGQFDGTGGVRDEAGAWTSVLAADAGRVRGCAISPDGRAQREPIELPADRWRLVLRRGDAVLGVHIPAGEPMTHAACGESFGRAAAFFARHFPEVAYRAFHCGSWFLDNQFARLLPASSNIRRFQEEVYLYPLPGAGDEQTFERVFGRRFDDLGDAPRDTALRRAIVAHLRGGGHFHAGGMLLFPEDLNWGRKVYRRMHGLENDDG